jgi:hypothetical protein
MKYIDRQSMEKNVRDPELQSECCHSGTKRGGPKPPEPPPTRDISGRSGWAENGQDHAASGGRGWFSPKGQNGFHGSIEGAVGRPYR